MVTATALSLRKRLNYRRLDRNPAVNFYVAEQKFGILGTKSVEGTKIESVSLAEARSRVTESRLVRALRTVVFRTAFSPSIRVPSFVIKSGGGGRVF